MKASTRKILDNLLARLLKKRDDLKGNLSFEPDEDWQEQYSIKDQAEFDLINKVVPSLRKALREEDR